MTGFLKDDIVRGEDLHGFLGRYIGGDYSKGRARVSVRGGPPVSCRTKTLEVFARPAPEGGYIVYLNGVSLDVWAQTLDDVKAVRRAAREKAKA